MGILQQRGFTLVETIITLGLISIILMASFSLFVTGIKTWEKTESNLELRQSAAIALRTIEEVLLNSSRVEIINEHHEYVTDGETLIIHAENGDCITFYVKDNQLFRKKGGGSNPVCSNIEEINFKKENSLINIRVEMKKDNYHYYLGTKILIERGEKVIN